jgi:nitrite reductase/ring-hydroxylating ferredoxin subunit
MWMKVCLTSELLPGSMLKADILGHTIIMTNVDGRFYAMDGICSHGFADLSRGRLEGYILECPLHRARYDVRTGEVVSGPIGA